MGVTRYLDTDGFIDWHRKETDNMTVTTADPTTNNIAASVPNGATPAPAASGLPSNVRSLRNVLKSHTLDSLVDDGTVFYFTDVTKGPTGRKLRGGAGDEVAYDLTLMAQDGAKMGKVRIVKPSIGEQLESADVVGAGADDWYGPVRIVKNGRAYTMQAAD